MRDTKLLCTNKQIAKEATGMFYYENTYAIPEALFTGDVGILEMMEGPLYHMSKEILASLRNVKVCVPLKFPRLTLGSEENVC